MCCARAARRVDSPQRFDRLIDAARCGCGVDARCWRGRRWCVRRRGRAVELPESQPSRPSHGKRPRASRALCACQRGDQLAFSRPFGRFTLSTALLELGDLGADCAAPAACCPSSCRQAAAKPRRERGFARADGRGRPLPTVGPCRRSARADGRLPSARAAAAPRLGISAPRGGDTSGSSAFGCGRARADGPRRRRTAPTRRVAR